MRVPEAVPAVHWVRGGFETERIGRVSALASRLIGEVDNSAYPAIHVEVPMVVVKPVAHDAPMPVLIMFVLGAAGLSSAGAPSADDIARMNAALKASIARQDPALGEVLRQHPAWRPIPTPPFFSAASSPHRSDPAARVTRLGRGTHRPDEHPAG